MFAVDVQVQSRMPIGRIMYIMLGMMQMLEQIMLTEQ